MSKKSLIEKLEPYFEQKLQNTGRQKQFKS
jgi:hypothetical protein